MLTQADEIVLAHWRTVRERALEAHRKMSEHAPDVEHDMPGLVAACDVEIAKLEAKASLPAAPTAP